MTNLEASQVLDMVDYLKSQRTMTAEEVDAAAASHSPLIRYALQRHPSAAAGAAH